MQVTSPAFPAFVLAVCIVFLLKGGGTYRRAVFGAASALFLLSQLRGVADAAPLALFLAAGFAALRLVARWRRPGLLAAAIATIVVLFVYLKRYSFLSYLGVPESPYFTLGLSYILFRLIHVLVDVHEGAIESTISLRSYLSYMCSFLTVVSGPIQRYEDFSRQEAAMDRLVLSRETVYNAFSRILNGYLKIALVSQLLILLHGSFPLEDLASGSVAWQWWAFWGRALTYTAYMYWNFAGYMDVVIGCGALFGFELPENFNRPFASENFLEFWTRWHITLSDWFRIYVFNPILKYLTYRVSSPKAAPYLGVLAFFATFLLMGLWHGSTGAFVWYGLFLGGGVSLNRSYQVVMRNAIGRQRYATIRSGRLYRALGRGVTCAYFSVGLSCFWYDPSELLTTVLSAGFGITLVGFGVAAVLLAGALGLWRRAGDFAMRKAGPCNGIWSYELFRQAVLTGKAFILFLVMTVGLQATPQLVYRIF